MTLYHKQSLVIEVEAIVGISFMPLIDPCRVPTSQLRFYRTKNGEK